MMLKQIPIFSLLYFLSFLCVANNFYSFKRFTIDNPLSYKSVRTIAQDADGYMWFGSQEGLHRFDGYELKTYLHDIEQPSSLSSDVISRVMIDSKNRLWLATRGGGVNLFNRVTGEFYHFTTSTEQHPITSDNVNALLEDKQGNIWIGTEQGLNILSLTEGTWKVKQILASNTQGFSHNTVHSLVQTKTGKIWAGTNGGGISLFDEAGDFVRNINFKELSTNDDLALLINNLFEDAAGFIWVGTIENGLIKYNPTNGDYIHFKHNPDEKDSITSNTIEWIFQDSRKALWIATDKGLVIRHTNQQTFQRVNYVANNPYSLTNDFVLNVFEDKDNIIWVGTFSGVNRWDRHMETFNQYDEQNGVDLSASLVTGFSSFNDGSIAVAVYDGAVYKLSNVNDRQIIVPLNINQEIKHLRISSLLVTQQYIWVGTRSSGLFRFDLDGDNSQVYKHIKSNNSSISANSITNIFEDSKGTIWVSTYHNGFNRLNSDGSFTQFTFDKSKPNQGPNSDHVLQILEDEQGFLWLATYGGGISRFNPNTNQFMHFTSNDADSLSSNLSWTMHFDRSGNLWVGTQAGGLNLLTAENRINELFKFGHFSIKHGLKDQTVYGITEDNKGNIWFSSNNGISRFSPALNSFKHFDHRHGLTDLEFNHGAVYQCADGSLYFGSAQGFSSINPDKVLADQKPPTVRLNNIYRHNEVMSFKQTLSELSKVVFEYNDQLVAFEYVGLNYSAPEATRYKYRLKGFDEQWVDAGKLRRATYTNLPAGNYIFEVTAANSDSLWSDNSYQLQVIVNPAPWNTWWAYLLYVFSLALALLFYSRLMNAKLVAEQKQRVNLKEQVIEKTEKYVQKNLELEHANRQLAKVAIIDKATGVKSRRYLDIYIEQASALMLQIHNNLKPMQRNLLPRLYIMMIHIENIDKVSNSQILSLVDLIDYSCEEDDLVVRWSDSAFAIISYEKNNNAADLAATIATRLKSSFTHNIQVKIAFSFFPFDLEHPFSYSWDQINMLTELAYNQIKNEPEINWVGLYGPKPDVFNLVDVVKTENIEELTNFVSIKYQ